MIAIFALFITKKIGIMADHSSPHLSCIKILTQALIINPKSLFLLPINAKRKEVTSIVSKIELIKSGSNMSLMFYKLCTSV